MKGEINLPGCTSQYGIHGRMHEVNFGNYVKETIEDFDKFPAKRFSELKSKAEREVVTDHENLTMETMRCAWTSLLANGMKKSDKQA